ncbi:MAG: hypothetical protein ABMB14_17410 [Myxococcota bacterium]
MDLERPWPYRRRKLRRAAGGIAWAALAVAALARARWAGLSPEWGVALIALAPLALLSLVPPLRDVIREIRAAWRVRPLVAATAAALLAGDPAAAEAYAREALATPGLGPPALGPLIHNLGVARSLQGLPDGPALIALALDSGWITARAIRAGDALLGRR